MQESGVNLDCNYEGCSPLYEAVTSKQLHMVKYLIDNRLCNINFTSDYYHHSVLMIAIQESDEESVRLLLEAGADCNISNVIQDTPLIRAAQQGNSNILNQLLQHPNCSKMCINQYEQSALHKACLHGHTNCVSLLLENGCLTFEKDHMTTTPLHIASEQGHALIVDKLLQAGHPVDIRTADGKTALHLAIEKNHLNCVKYLLKYSTLLHSRYGEQSLHVAANLGHTNVLKYLCAYNSRLEERDYSGHTPLHKALINRHVECVEELVKRGADVNAKFLPPMSQVNDTISAGRSLILPVEYAATRSNHKSIFYIIKCLAANACSLKISTVTKRQIQGLVLKSLGISQANYIPNALVLHYIGINFFFPEVQQVAKKRRLDQELLSEKQQYDEILEEFLKFAEVISKPHTLQCQCSRLIRYRLGSKFKSKVSSLPVPGEIKNLVALDRLESFLDMYI